jgi:PST family polysaccharide transporter
MNALLGIPLMGLKQKALKGIVWSGARVWGSRIISFLAFAVLSRLLAPKDFGIVAMASLFISFIQTFQDQGLGDAIVQRRDLQQEHLDTAFWTNLLMGCLLTLLGFGCSNFIAGLFHESQLVLVIRWLSLSFVLAGLSGTQQAILRRNLAFKELALRSLCASIAGGIIGLWLAILGLGVWSLVFQNLVTALIGVVVLWKVSQWRPKFRFSFTHFKELFTFGINIVGIQILNFFNRHADDLLIGYFLGPTQLGFYTVAYRLVAIMTDLLTSVTNAVAFPIFSRLQHEPERMGRAFYQVTYYTSLISFPAFIGVAVIAPELVVVVFGRQWTPSIPVMQVLAFIGILHSMAYFYSSIFMAGGKPVWSLCITLANAVSNVIAFVFAVQWGIVAVAAAYVLRGYLLSPLPIWALRRLIAIDLKTYLRQFTTPLAGSALMVSMILSIKIIMGQGLELHFRLVAYIIGGCISYLMMIRWLDTSVLQKIISLLQEALPQWKAGKT